MGTEDGDDDFFDQFKKEDYDSFFDEESESKAPPQTQAPAEAQTPMPTRASAAGLEAGDIESEYEILSHYSPGDLPNGRSKGPSDGKALEECHGQASHSAATFSMADDDDDGCDADMDMVQSGFQKDLCLPEVPAAPPGFSGSDLLLREALAGFYTKHCAEKLPSINAIVEQYRGRAVSSLWAQLALKYKVPAPEAVDLLASTLYMDSVFEYDDAQSALALEGRLRHLTWDVPDELHQELHEMLENRQPASLEVVRAICFRGLSEDLVHLRPCLWKVLLGLLPLERRSDWIAMDTERRSLYSSYRSDVLVVTASHKLEVKLDAHQARRALDILQQIQKDVERTRQESEAFQRPAVRAELSALLFVFAHRNPDVQYVQGMHEVAALLYSVLSVDPAAAEADTFWCFSAIMREMRQELLGMESGPAMPESVAHVDRLLKAYDPELFIHLQKSDCPVSVFSFRWCTLLFAQDVVMPAAASVWEVLFSDPRRFEFVVHLCIAVLLAIREDLLCTDDPGVLAGLLREAPRQSDPQRLLQLARAICAFERRAQTPPFPVRSASQVARDVTGWAKRFGADMARSFQGTCPPGVKDKAGQAVCTAAAAAQGGAQAVKDWLEQPAPLQPETIEKATAQVASLWQGLRSKGAAAMSRTKELAVEYGQADRSS